MDLGLLRHLVWSSLWQWLIASTIGLLLQRSVLDVETVASEYTGLDYKAFQFSASPFLKVYSKQHYLMLVLFSFISLYLFTVVFFF